ncbi:MAG: VacJ family lipoprotein [Alphaproteobacteria bacterium]|nr:VacJ family lipoprotein [Alphaproteobacteria bacterium]
MHGLRRTFAVALALAIAVSVGGAFGQGLAPDVQARLQATVASSQILTQKALALSQSLQNPALARVFAENARQNADTALASAVIAEITRSPASADAVVATAVALAPASRPAIVAATAAAFPALATRIQGGTPGIFLGVPPVQIASGAPPPPFVPGAPRPQTAPSTGLTEPVLRRTAPLPTDTALAPGSAPPSTMQRGPRRAPRAGAASSEPQSDPLEGYNRAMFAVNDVIDTFTLRPIAAAYGYVTPEVAKEAVRRALLNLNSPVIFANDLLQLDAVGAGITAGRFVINSTVGVLGLIDVARLIGLEPHHADFGQTMFGYGVGAGPYLVLPILGPATLRDWTGRGVDVFFDPLTYVLSTGQSFAVAGTKGLIKREELLVPLEELRAGSVDYYAALRAAYYQNRAVELGLSTPGTASKAVDKLFDEAE